MTLGDYLTAATRERWAWGVRDCTTFPGDWACTWGRGDPMAEWRGQYSTDRDAYRLIGHAGGLVELWRRGLASIGLGEVDAPEIGDVGVVMALTDAGAEPVGAIWTGERWAWRADAGVMFGPGEVLAIWGPRSE